MHNLSVAELSKLLQTRKLSAVELAQHYLDRIRQWDDQLGSFVTVTEARALADAKTADELLATGNAPLLTGVPIAHKDIFCTQGIKTSACSKMLDNFIAPYESTVSQKLKDAGTVLLGKTNMDEFAMGSSNENSYYAAVKNPWDLTRIPGGSSGGSAASVAASLTPLATGTDTGGSIRQPAALCGITGIRPTYGRVSRYGQIAFASSLDQAGCFGHSSEDCAYMLQAMAGFDPKDATSVDRPVDDYIGALNNSLKGKKVGIPEEYFTDALPDTIKTAIDQCQQTLAALGAELVSISLPQTKLATATYYILAPAEASANLARFDGVRYGYRCEQPKDLEDLYIRSRSEGFGDEVKRRILIGTYVLSSGFYDAYYTKAQKLRRLFQDDFKAAFDKVDAILTPTTPTTAFKFGEKHDPENMYLSDIYTIAVNLAGVCGLSMPVGFSNGLPIGAQLIGNFFDEATILNIAHQYQQQTDWHSQRPSFGA